jgi:hypothetical protein
MPIIPDKQIVINIVLLVNILQMDINTAGFQANPNGFSKFTPYGKPFDLDPVFYE